MSNTYNWTIERIEYQPTAHGQNKVANILHWVYAATDETGNFTANLFNSTVITYDPTSVYIDFDNLTHDIVVGWLEAALGSETIASFKTQLDTKLEELASPKSVITTPPWNV